MRSLPNKDSAGGVLLAAVAAMLVLLLLGRTVTEQFASQRRSRVLTLEASRAFWIAEAGVAHAIALGTSILVPQAYGGGFYEVTKVGAEFTSTGTLGEASQTVVRRAEDVSGL